MTNNTREEFCNWFNEHGYGRLSDDRDLWETGTWLAWRAAIQTREKEIVELKAALARYENMKPKWYHCTAPVDSWEFLNSDERYIIVDAEAKGELSVLEDDGYLIEPMFTHEQEK
jgi:hypothetical protein